MLAVFLLLALLFQRVAVQTVVGVGADGNALSECTDQDANCKLWANQGECAANVPFMSSACRSACFLCQSVDCHDHVEECRHWAAAGECANNENYMVSHCGFSCRTCFVNQTAECRRPVALPPVAVAGTIDETFEALVQGPLAPRVLHRDPWVLQFDDFMTSEEADELVAAAGHNFEQSRFLGDDEVKGEMPRTSTTSWCNVPSCLENATFQAIRDRISAAVRVPWLHSEHLQLLRYHEGQYYKEHHDQISPPESAWGPRLYTFFMYLSDVVEGGETNFTKLNISVAPRKGAAILWPSVLSSDLHATDERTMHESLPVVRGTKYAANFWVHLWDFQTYHAAGCDNRPYLQHAALVEVATAGGAVRGAPSFSESV